MLSVLSRKKKLVSSDLHTAILLFHMLTFRTTIIIISWEMECRGRCPKKLKVFFSPFFSADDPRITKWMNKKQLKNTSPDMQNEMLKVSIFYVLEIHKI